MPLFFHDIYAFRDPVGGSIWRVEHQYEHTQFVTTYQKQTPSKGVPDYDLSSWDDGQQFVTRWLVSHEAVHQQLRALSGVAGVNLSDVDFSKEDEFYDWLDVHRTEHILLRQALGIT